MGDGYDRALTALVPAVESIKVGDPGVALTELSEVTGIALV